jgi:uncharacterized protein YoxC
MAETLHSLAIQIQGKVDSALGDSINAVQGHIKKLGDGVKALADSKTKTDPITGAFVKLSAESAKAARDVEELNRSMKLVDGFKAQRDATESAARKYDEARDALYDLEQQQANSKTPEFTNKLKRARKEAIEAEKAYNKEKKTLDGLDKKLKDAGVNTEDLTEEQKKLAEEMENASRRSEQLERSLQRMTEVKYGVQKLGGQFKQLGSDLAWVGKTWAAMGGAVAAAGAGLYAISDSVAATGDAAAKSAAKLHMSTDAFQQLNYAAGLSGVKDFDAMMVKMNANLAKFAKDDKGDTEVRPWFEYGGQPYHFNISIDATLPDRDAWEKFFLALDVTKSVRDWLDAIEIRRETTAELFYGLGTAASGTVDLGLGLPDEGCMTIYAGTGMMITGTIEIYQTEEAVSDG